ncbi:hypothetical protein [Flavobacterium sp.]|uniref:hypothetical protein n=1 Tax=Flavobacterium sp. TaxID=239 RepID=UPI003D13BD08
MKKLELDQMENLKGGLTSRQVGCGVYGLAAGIASGFNPLVGGLTTLACFLTTSERMILTDEMAIE